MPLTDAGEEIAQETALAGAAVAQIVRPFLAMRVLALELHLRLLLLVLHGEAWDTIAWENDTRAGGLS
jgi:hypothetical protein